MHSQSVAAALGDSRFRGRHHDDSDMGGTKLIELTQLRLNVSYPAWTGVVALQFLPEKGGEGGGGEEEVKKEEEEENEK